MRVKTAALFMSTATVLILTTGAIFAQTPSSPSLPSNPPVSSPSSSSGTQSQSSALVNFSSQLAIAALGGFIGWILTTTINFLILRQRLISYLIVVTNVHLREYNDSVQWLNAVKDKTIKKNHLIKLSAEYTKNELSDLRGVRGQNLKLLRTNELIRITKMIQRMSEIEALMDGFCNSLQRYKDKEIVLDESEIEHLSKKRDRILSYIHVLPEKIEKIKDLPIDYSGIHGAEVLVTNSSATPDSQHS